MTADLDVTSDHDGSGYTLVISFDQALTSFEQWSGTASSSDQKYEMTLWIHYNQYFVQGPGLLNPIREYLLEEHSAWGCSWASPADLTW